MDASKLRDQVVARFRAQYEEIWNAPEPTPEDVERNRAEFLARLTPNERAWWHRALERMTGHPRRSWRTPENLELFSNRKADELMPMLLAMRREYGVSGDLSDEEFHEACLDSAEASIESTLARFADLASRETDPTNKEVKQRLLEAFREGRQEIVSASRAGRVPDPEELVCGIREFTDWLRSRQMSNEEEP